MIPAINYQSHIAYADLTKSRRLSERVAALKTFLPVFWKTYRTADIQDRLHDRARVDNVGADAYMLATLGARAFRVPPERMRALRELLEKPRQELLDRLAGMGADAVTRNSHRQLLFGRKDPAVRPIYAMVSDIFRDAGVLKAASEYAGVPYVVGQCGLQINNAEDAFRRSPYTDMDIAAPPTRYMHIDSSVLPLKCIFYLDTVTQKTGPFSVVLGSHNQVRSKFDLAIRKTIHALGWNDGTPDVRRQFAALPAILQRKAEFGNDLLDPSEQQKLLAREYHFTTDNGEIVLFNSDAIHRGGFVEEGQRYIMQVSLKPTK